MRILYIGRSDGFGLKSWLKQQKRRLSFGEQDGFFEASLYSGAKVVETTIQNCERDLKRGGFDAVVVNLKCGGFADEGKRDEFFITTFGSLNVPKALFIGSAKAEQMVSDQVADVFDVIFKREPYKDRTRYQLSTQNREKIMATMISCPFVTLSRDSFISKLYTSLQSGVKVCHSAEATVDVGFSGAAASSHTMRQDAWARVKGGGFSTVGGLQKNPYLDVELKEELKGPRFEGKAYRDALCKARINLALPGIGAYTFRHQELLYLGAFMLSHSSIDELELPMPLKPGEHYVSFNTTDEMADKIRYYLNHETERQQIATSGKKLFDEYYQPKRHGAELFSALKKGS